MTLDSNNQPLSPYFNRSRNIEKAMFGLKGILQGVIADEKLNEQELLFLDTWLRSEKHLEHDGDVIDLLDQIGEILKDGVITSEELSEIQDMINDILEFKELHTPDEEAQINELIGLLSGIASDNILDDSEIDSLRSWLDKNQNLATTWPASEITKRLNLIIQNGAANESDRAELLETIKQITGNRFQDTGLAHGMATEFFEDHISDLTHRGSCYCFTGSFVTGTRKVVEDDARLKGAETKKDVSKAVHYLVIGTLASRDWRFSSHGRKIEKALKLQKSGHPIKIITERTWIRHK